MNSGGLRHHGWSSPNPPRREGSLETLGALIWQPELEGTSGSACSCWTPPAYLPAACRLPAIWGEGARHPSRWSWWGDRKMRTAPFSSTSHFPVESTFSSVIISFQRHFLTVRGSGGQSASVETVRISWVDCPPKKPPALVRGWMCFIFCLSSHSWFVDRRNTLGAIATSWPSAFRRAASFAYSLPADTHRGRAQKSNGGYHKWHLPRGGGAIFNFYRAIHFLFVTY